MAQGRRSMGFRHRQARPARGGWLAVLAAMALAGSAGAATIPVTTTADNTIDDADCTLREAILSANNDASPNPGDCVDGSGADIVEVPAGTYALTTGTALVIATSMTIRGADPGSALLTTTIQGNGSDRVFDVNAAVPIDVTLQWLRIEQGRADAGGGVRVNLPGGSVTVDRCEITNNEANSGGGMWIGMTTGTAAVTIRESALTFNRATNSSPAGLQDGGGLYHASAGTVEVRNTTFSNNTADDNGGGIAHEGSGTLLLNNVTIAHNQAEGDGGGAGDGGGIYRGMTTGTATIANTIIADNTDSGVATHPDCSGTFVSGNSNLVESTAGCSGFTGDADHFGFAITLAALGDYGGPTRSVGPNSVADQPPVDRGNQGTPTTACEAVDQRGVPRPQGAACDIGALELAQCGDGILCNVDGCIPLEQCDDGNTDDGDCCSSTCQFEPAGSSCDDGLFCTATDTCDGSGTCVGSGDPCPGPDGDGNCAESCDEAADNCQAPDPKGTSCNDGLFCNGTDTCDGSGACANHAGDPCAGGGQCNDTCDEANDNCFSPKGTSCDDGLFCTATDTCDGSGTCVGSGDPCPGPDGDGNCAESCDEAADNCKAPDPKGTSCDDGLFCTATDTCDGAGSCTGTGDPCAGGPECNNGPCDEANDNCFAAAGTACSDEGDACTVDECDGGGSCAHTFIDADGDGVCDLVENGAPNGGDGNNDGTPDSQQDFVTSLPNAVDGSYMTFVTNPCPHANVTAVDPAALNAKGYRLPFGALSFELPSCGSTHVTIFYHNIPALPAPPYRYLKRGPNPPGSATNVVYFLEEGAPNNVSFGTAAPYGVPVGVVEFDLADGALGDDTGADDDIFDQGGPALPAPAPTPATTPLGLAVALLILVGLAARRLLARERTA